VAFKATRRPRCTGTDLRTYSTKRYGAVVVRYHICRACGLNFKSHEVVTAKAA